MELIETKVFTRQILTLLSDDEYRQFQNWLVVNPDLGKRIPGTSGLRKIRVAFQEELSAAVRESSTSGS